MIISVIVFAIGIIGLFTRHGVLAYFCFLISGVIFIPTSCIWVWKKAGLWD
ncbi:MAG: hypothetical protein J6N21_19350 [Butyrivibrio sp.]|nr:hypothetical protein [Butyrivibrio sp.]